MATMRHNLRRLLPVLMGGGGAEVPLFADGFESGDLTAWSSTTGTDISVSEAAALIGTYGFAMLIDDTNAKYVQDDMLNAEKHYRFRFYIDPNTVTMAAGNIFNMFTTGSITGYSIIITLEYNDSVYKIRLSVRLDSGSYAYFDRVVLTDEPHYIEVEWKAATADGANDGYAKLWVDGSLRQTSASLDNDTTVVRIAYLGAISGLDVGTSGTIFFDAFESRRSTYIGPAEAPTWASYTTRLADAPVAVSSHGFVELSGLLYSVSGGHQTYVYAYNPATNTWTEKADYPIGVQSLCVRAVNGKLYGIGGHNSDTHVFYGDVYEYDPAANTWTQKTSMPTPREDFGSAVIDGKIYCFGGLTDTPADYTPTKVLEIYDPATDTWDVTKADMPDYKHFGDFGEAVDGKIYAIGGSNTFADYPLITPHNTIYEYDPGTDTWAIKAACVGSTSYREIVALNGKIYQIGGCTISNYHLTSSIYTYTPATDTWEALCLEGGAPYLASYVAFEVYNGSIYMCGGVYSKGSSVNYLYRLDL